MANGFRHGGRREWATLLILGMLCVRALIPAGYMLAPVDGRAELVLCAPGLLGGAGHHHAGHHHSDHDHSHADPTCPFAQSTGPAPLPSLPALAAASMAVVLALPTQTAQTCLSFGPVRKQFPRGPPHLA